MTDCSCLDYITRKKSSISSSPTSSAIVCFVFTSSSKWSPPAVSVLHFTKWRTPSSSRVPAIVWVLRPSGTNHCGQRLVVLLLLCLRSHIHPWVRVNHLITWSEVWFLSGKLRCSHQLWKMEAEKTETPAAFFPWLLVCLYFPVSFIYILNSWGQLSTFFAPHSLKVSSKKDHLKKILYEIDFLHSWYTTFK